MNPVISVTGLTKEFPIGRPKPEAWRLRDLFRRHGTGGNVFRALDNLKFDWVSFLQSTVTFTDDGGIMDKNVRPVIAPDEAVPFGIVKPFHGSVHFTWPPNSNL